MSCKQDAISKEDRVLTLKINEKDIPIVPFVHDSFRDMILGFVKNLKGYEDGKIEIKIRR